MATSVLRAIVTADTAGAQAQLAAVGATVDKVGTQGAKTLGAFGKVSTYAFAAAGAAAIAFGVVSVKAFQQHQTVLLQLQKAIARTPTLVGASTQAFQEQAMSLEALTGVQHDEILAADTVLTRFKLTGQQIQQIIPLVLDYARVTGQDATTAATSLGRAFLGNTRALKTIGITFKATGNTAEDFNTIMGLLQQKVGGAAQAFGTTLAGKLDIFKAKLNDVEEAAGGALLPALTKILGVATALLPALGAIAKVLPELILGFVAMKVAAFALGALPGLLLNVAVGMSTIVSAGAGDAVLGVAVGAEAMGAALSTAIPFIGLAAAGLLILAHTTDGWSKATKDAAATIIQFGSKSREAAAAVAELTFQDERLHGRTYNLQQSSHKLTATIAQLDAQHRALSTSLSSDTMQFVQLAAQAERTTSDITKQRDAVLGLIAANLQLAGGFLGVKGAALSARQAQLALDQAIQQHHKDSKDAHTTNLQLKQDQLAIAQAQLGAVQAQQSLSATIVDYADKQIKAGTATQTVINEVKRFADQAGLTKGQTDALIASVSGLIAKNKDLPHFVRTQYQTPGLADALSAAQVYEQVLNSIPKDVTTRFHTARAIGAQHGFEGWVTQPTVFLTGEDNQAEYVSVKPKGQMGGGRSASSGGQSIVLNFHAPIYGLPDFERQVESAAVRAFAKAAAR